MNRAPLTPRKYSWYPFLLDDHSTPATKRSKGEQKSDDLDRIRKEAVASYSKKLATLIAAVTENHKSSVAAAMMLPIFEPRIKQIPRTFHAPRKKVAVVGKRTVGAMQLMDLRVVRVGCGLNWLRIVCSGGLWY